MRYIGVDVGTKYTGFAFSDMQGIYAFPLGECETHQIYEKIDGYAKEYETDHFVFGDGRGFGEKEMPRVVEKIETILLEMKAKKYTTYLQQEIYSSQEAMRYTKKGGHDKAAAIILQRFLDIQNDAH